MKDQARLAGAGDTAYTRGPGSGMSMLGRPRLQAAEITPPDFPRDKA